MGTWRIPADVLAGGRFTLSPIAEVVGALGALERPRSPEARAFGAAHRAAWQSWLAERPAAAELVRACFRDARPGLSGWMADFLALPPRVPDPTFEHGLSQLRALSEDELRRDLRETTRAELAPGLLAPGLSELLADTVRWLWTHTLETDWARREQILRADIVARTAQLGQHGWGAVLRDLGRDREWVGNGQLRINRFDNPTRTLSPGARLMFVPTHTEGSWVGWDHDADGERYAVYYPLAGRLAQVDARNERGLGALVGSNRAALLVLLDVPRSTSHLAALSGLALGSVGAHLKVLLEAGAVLRRRSGREVLYWRTPLGDSLVASGTPATAGPDA
jgi:DNA-binding transcriptional ArsR family regulator